MYDTARRVTLVKQQVRVETARWRQQRQGQSASPQRAMLLMRGLDAGGGHGRRAGQTTA